MLFEATNTTEPLLVQLNAAQQQAVVSDAQNILVLAGAGSGKTRVLVHRIAWLIQQHRVPPHAILAVTFTNKASKEMSERIETILNMPLRGMWVGTFHGLAHRLLRTHWNTLGLLENFQILDSDDQKRLIKRIMKELQIDDKELPLKEIQSFINHCKENGRRYADLEPVYDYRYRCFHEIYATYEKICQRSSLVDFAELLLRAHELWLHHPEVLAHYQQRFRYILVDEFQDTNTIQYAWIKVLSGVTKHPLERSNVMVVGDDDQSIYGWRGAKIEHIQKFEKDFSPASLIRLEQNYRSSGNILAAANAIISHNQDRLGKTLWTEDKQGEPIYVYRAFNEYDEAEYVTATIKNDKTDGGLYHQMAVLYRSNAQSRILEEYLINASIPYRVYGGLRFFDRAEIKDALAYLRLIFSPSDDAAFERVINLPARGIGQKSIEKLRQHARQHSQPLWASLQSSLKEKLFTPKTTKTLANFVQMIEDFSLQLVSQHPESSMEENISLFEILDQVYLQSGLREYHGKDRSEKSLSRVENLDELVNALKQFEQQYLDPFDDENNTASTSAINILADFLGNAVLESTENQGEKWDDCVQLMTLHSAKGLEFPQVFMVGMEHGLFPHRMTMNNDSDLSEERRLCYVGITRAMKNLHLSFADSRTIHGKTEISRPSQFLSEIPTELLHQVRLTSKSYPVSPRVEPQQVNSNRIKTMHNDTDEYYPGKQVFHKKFGEGTIIEVDGDGEKQRVHVNFKNTNSRWLLARLAKLD